MTYDLSGVTEVRWMNAEHDWFYIIDHGARIEALPWEGLILWDALVAANMLPEEYIPPE